MAKHTPGPWTLHRRGGASDYVVRDASGANGLPICEMWTTSAPLSEREANARLIAAAPEMHGLLLEILDNLTGLPTLSRARADAYRQNVIGRIRDVLHRDREEEVTR